MAAAALAVMLAPATARADYGITTVAGNGNVGFGGDGGPALAAVFATPIAVAALPGGGYLVADPGNHRVRRVAPDGTITTVAGDGTAGSGGDNGPATSAQLNFPRGLGVYPDGSFLIADRDANDVRKVAADGTITTVAGTGAGGLSGDNGPATAATIDRPYGAAPLPDGGFLIADRGNNVIRRVAPNGTITTVAGTGAGGLGGDGGPATAAQLNVPCAVAVASDGTFYIPDRDNGRVRRVAPDGTITTVAAGLGGPYSVAILPDGSLVIGERDGNRIDRLAPDGRLSTLAGTGAGGFAGDGGPAPVAQLNTPLGVALLPSGAILVADSSNNRIRALTAGFVPAPAPAVAAPVAAAPPTPAATRAPALVARLLGLRRGRLRFTLSRAALVRIVVTRHGRRVAAATVHGRRGTNAVRLRRLRAGRYVVRLTVRAPDGATSSVKRVLTLRN